LIAAGDDNASQDSTTVPSPLKNLQLTFVMSSGKQRNFLKKQRNHEKLAQGKTGKIEPITNMMMY